MLDNRGLKRGLIFEAVRLRHGSTSQPSIACVDPANQGRVCDVGLWRWSRHPNYFFEWFGWLAYPVIALSIDHPLSYPWGWATLLAPVFMYWILVHVTGIPPLETQMLRSRGDRYRHYQSRTSAFFPLPPQA